MRSHNRDRKPYALLALANELLSLLADARGQIVAIKSELERHGAPVPPAAIPILVSDDPTLRVELTERIAAAGFLCARAYGYRSRSGGRARGGFPQVAARLRADLGIQRLTDMRTAQWSQALTALRRIEHDARRRLLDMSIDGADPATVIDGSVRADAARSPLCDAAGRPSPEPGVQPTPPREVP